MLLRRAAWVNGIIGRPSTTTKPIRAVGVPGSFCGGFPLLQKMTTCVYCRIRYREVIVAVKRMLGGIIVLRFLPPVAKYEKEGMMEGNMPNY